MYIQQEQHGNTVEHGKVFHTLVSGKWGKRIVVYSDIYGMNHGRKEKR